MCISNCVIPRNTHTYYVLVSYFTFPFTFTTIYEQDYRSSKLSTLYRVHSMRGEDKRQEVEQTRRTEDRLVGARDIKRNQGNIAQQQPSVRHNRVSG